MNLFKRKIGLLLSILFLLSFVVTAAGQSPQNQQSAEEMRQFRLARQYQVSDKHEQAVAILKNLYESYPARTQYYNQLLESLIYLSRIGEALALIDKQKAHDPTNPRYEIDYGSVLYKDGREKEAQKIWQSALEKHKNNVAIYTLVANAMLNHRLYDEAIEVYKKGYQQHPNRTYFLQNIASLYRNRFEYGNALEYYLAYLKAEPDQHHSVTRLILSLEVEEKEVNNLAGMIEAEAKKNKAPELQLLLAKFYQKYGKYEEALKIYQSLENEKTKGEYLLNFARAMQADSLYQLALSSYEAIIERYPQSQYLLLAYLGAAKCNLELAQSQNETVYAEKAIAIIKQVRNQYPKHPEVAELSLVEGLIYKRFFFDIDKAIEIFREMRDIYRNRQEIFDRASILLGECYLIRGNLNRAAAVLPKVESAGLRAQALLYLAKIEFYQGNFSECLNYINKIIQLEGAAGLDTNNALELQLLLQHSESHPEALKLFAEADWLLFQGKKSEAISKIKSALEVNPPNALKAQMLVQAAQLSRELDKPLDAVEFCNAVLKDSTMLIYADEALFLMANIFENDLEDLSRAFELYDRLLIEFPQSQFSHTARARLVEIRDQLKEVMP